MWRHAGGSGMRAPMARGWGYGQPPGAADDARARRPLRGVRFTPFPRRRSRQSRSSPSGRASFKRACSWRALATHATSSPTRLPWAVRRRQHASRRCRTPHVRSGAPFLEARGSASRVLIDAHAAHQRPRPLRGQASNPRSGRGVGAGAGGTCPADKAEQGTSFARRIFQALNAPSA
jgi:hypothetical protein